MLPFLLLSGVGSSPDSTETRLVPMQSLSAHQGVRIASWRVTEASVGVLGL
jgi:hypothetical protein